MQQYLQRRPLSLFGFNSYGQEGRGYVDIASLSSGHLTQCDIWREYVEGIACDTPLSAVLPPLPPQGKRPCSARPGPRSWASGRTVL
jgi:hypothetical protein